MERINFSGVVFFLLLLSGTATAQVEVDSMRTRTLEEVTIQGEKLFSIERLPKIHGAYLWSGKKNEVINVQNLDANITEKTPRQIFSKVPGVFVYDMDGSGNDTRRKSSNRRARAQRHVTTQHRRASVCDGGGGYSCKGDE